MYVFYWTMHARVLEPKDMQEFHKISLIKMIGNKNLIVQLLKIIFYRKSLNILYVRGVNVGLIYG